MYFSLRKTQILLCDVSQVKARQEACAQAGFGQTVSEQLETSPSMKEQIVLPLKVQYPILQHFGFQPSRRGVAQSVAAFKEHNAHPEASAQSVQVQALVVVSLVTCLSGGRPKCKVAVPGQSTGSR